MSTEKNAFLPIITLALRRISLPILVLIGALIALSLIDYSFIVWLPNWHRKIAIGVLQLSHFVTAGCLYWILIRLLNVITSLGRSTSIASIIVKFISNALKALILLSLVGFVVNYLPVPKSYAYLIDRLTSIFIIGAVTWLAIRLVEVTEQLIAIKYNISNTENVLARKTHTQLIILKRIVIGLILVIALGAVFLLFDTVRELGTSILASAGIVGVVAGFAAQKSLNSLIIGLQIALNQPIKINDYVFIENTFGQVEEITSFYVVLKAWDLRRVIIPINYFLEKSFQNLSRNSTNLLGTIMVYVDYTLPIATLREALKDIMAQSKIWDKKFYNLQVSDCKETTIELRILVSAINPSNEWDLRCEVREALINFIQIHYPECLPKQRLLISSTTA